MARRLVLNGALKRTPAGTATEGAGLPRYAFIAHPACCPMCNTMDSRITGRLYTVGDTWRISHINCKCSTIEVPAGMAMGAEAVRAFAANPVGGTLRRGFNYGQSFTPVKLTQGNVAKAMEKATRLADETRNGRAGRFARVNVIAQQKGAYRRAYNKGKENWNNVEMDMPKVTPKKGESFDDFVKRAAPKKTTKQKASVVKVRSERAERPMFTMGGGISNSVDVKKKKKKKAQQIAANRKASSSTKSMAKLFGAEIR